MYPTDDKSSLINIVNMSQELLNNYKFVKVLENENTVYQDNENLKFRSVPLKYMNSNYFSFKKNILSLNGEINLIAKRDITISIFKDRNAGAIIENGYTDTGDIVTAYSGTEEVIYKVYSKNFLEGEKVVLNTKTLLTNRVTNYANIVSVKSTHEVENNAFMIDTTSYYETIDDFRETWDLYELDPNNNNQSLEQKENYFSILMESTTGGATLKSMSEISRQMAKLYGRFKFSYHTFIDAGNYDNNFLRVWVVNGSPSVWEDGTANIAPNSLVETYFSTSNNRYGIVYRTATGTNQNTYFATPITKGVWTDKIEYILDVRNKKYDIKVGNNTVKSALEFRQLGFNYADYIMFATRATNTSKYWFRDIVIEPIEDEIIGGFTVNGNSISYTGYTKDYLYSSSDLTNKNVVVNTSSTNYGVSSVTNETNYTEINGTSSATYGSIPINHRVYYELSGSRVGITATIEEALDLDQVKYTAYSWQDLVDALDVATNVIANPEASTTSLTDAKTNLENAINGLILKTSAGKKYTANIYPGNTYENMDKKVYITPNSSFTMNAKIDAIFGSTYTYANVEHVRKLITSTPLPIGTSITMIDKSNDTLSYYYYIVNSNDTLKTEYLLSDFTLMAGTSNYVNTTYYSSETKKVYENFDFMIDFSNAITPLNEGAYTIALNTVIGEEIRSMTNANFTISNQASNIDFQITTSEESIDPDEIIDFTLYAKEEYGKYNNEDVTDTTKFGKKVGVRFTLLDADKNQTTMPENAVITYDGVSCHIKNNACIIYLGDISTEISKDVTLDFGFGNNLSDGNYTLKGELFASFDGLLPQTIDSINDIELIISSVNFAGLKVSLDSAKINVIESGHPYTLLYEINKTNSSNSNIVVSIYKKENDEYILDNLANYINDALTPYDTNKYTLGNVSFWEPTLSSSVTSGTYRITFELYKDNVLHSTVNKYIVIK